MRKRFSVTMKDVAKRARVSISTVSHVINKTRTVEESTQKRVLKAMDELNYHPNVLAQSLRKQQTNTIAFIVSNLTNPYYPEAIRGVEQELQEDGYSVIVGNTDGDAGKEQELIKLFYGKQVDGFIVCTSGGDEQGLQFLIQHDIPVVLFDRKIEGLKLSAALVDNTGGAQTLVEHLITIGHKRIGIITGALNTSTGQERLEGYFKALKQSGIAREEQLIKEGDFKVPSGYARTVELLDLPAPPTAILVCNNRMGLGTIQALRDKGLQYPQDIGLAMFDDLPWWEYMNPSITAVEQPVFELGKIAAKLLLEDINDRGKPHEEIVLPVELKIRHSAGENRMFM